MPRWCHEWEDLYQIGRGICSCINGFTLIEVLYVFLQPAREWALPGKTWKLKSKLNSAVTPNRSLFLCPLDRGVYNYFKHNSKKIVSGQIVGRLWIRYTFILHSSPKELHIDFNQFSGWPQLTEPDPGSCRHRVLCKLLFRPFCKIGMTWGLRIGD